jgi:hypothetical protein
VSRRHRHAKAFAWSPAIKILEQTLPTPGLDQDDLPKQRAPSRFVPGEGRHLGNGLQETLGDGSAAPGVGSHLIGAGLYEAVKGRAGVSAPKRCRMEGRARRTGRLAEKSVH